jgi:hypothetical protein
LRHISFFFVSFLSFEGERGFRVHIPLLAVDG